MKVTSPENDDVRYITLIKLSGSPESKLISGLK